MKTPVAITLIIGGVVVVAIPALWSAWNSFMLSMTLTHLTQPNSSVSFAMIPDLYQEGCWWLGAGMIAISIGSSFIADQEKSDVRLVAGAA